MNQIQAKEQVLPSLAMLIKLINRKQSGSHPFSDSFNYDKIIKFLEDNYKEITNNDAIINKDFLSQAAVIARLSRFEVVNSGLKNDYYWLEETFKLVRDAMIENDLLYYLAYGSNLNLEQMKYRCHNSVLLGHGVIDNYALLYRESPEDGYFLTIEPFENRSVPFAVFKVLDDDVRSLDRYEGHIYYKKFFDVEITDLEGNKQKLNSFAYVLPTFRRAGLPQNYYIDIVKTGYKDNNFDLSILNQALTDTKKLIK